MVVSGTPEKLFMIKNLFYTIETSIKNKKFTTFSFLSVKMIIVSIDKVRMD